MFMCRLIYLFTFSFFTLEFFFFCCLSSPRCSLDRSLFHVWRACDFSCIRFIEIIFQCLFVCLFACHNATTYPLQTIKFDQNVMNTGGFFSLIAISGGGGGVFFASLWFYYSNELNNEISTTLFMEDISIVREVLCRHASTYSICI